MPDAFFSSSKSRKRKRVDPVKKTAKVAATSKKQHKGSAWRNSAIHGTNSVKAPSKKRARRDEELSDQTAEDDGGIDDLDLRPDAAMEEGTSGSEDEDETPAEKRLRLAQLYLDTVKESLGEFRGTASYRIKMPTIIHSRRRVRRGPD